MNKLPKHIKILHDVDAAYNNGMQTRLYKAGEVHEIGSPLMGEELTATLLKVHDEPDPNLHTSAPSQFEHRLTPGIAHAEATDEPANMTSLGVGSAMQAQHPGAPIYVPEGLMTTRMGRR